MALGYERGDTSVLCPYYVGSTEKTIICKGGLDPNGRVENKFKNTNRQREYRDGYCRSCFDACALCRNNDRALGFDRPPRS